MLHYDFSKCKFCNESSSVAKYKIRDGMLIFVCSSCDAHYINYFDRIVESPLDRKPVLSEEEFEYIGKKLHSNIQRFQSKVEMMKKYSNLNGAKVLDVGAGGGMFLHCMREQGAEVFGIEPNPIRIQYARQEYNLELCEHLLGHPYWQGNYGEFFDIITLWDVIEHVNYPVQLLREAKYLLKKGGLLFIDTPARNSFYYRFGQFTYFLTHGKYSTFLNAMYSNESYGHKQILSSNQLSGIAEQIGFESLFLKRFHELSFPYSFYLKRLLKSQVFARIFEPFVSALFSVVRIKNKMLLVTRKLQ